MKKAAAASLVFFTGCLAASITSVVINTGSGPVNVNVEIADDPNEWATGLMYRTELPQEKGMLFVFPDEAARTFWMKNTRIPLDIIFVSSDGKIIDIMRDFQPCNDTECARYTSKNPAKYVLEVNANFTAENDIKIGDMIVLRK